MGATVRPEQWVPRLLPDRSRGSQSADRRRRGERPEPPTGWRGGGFPVKTVSAAKIAAQFNDYLEAGREQPVLVTRNGKPVPVLMAVQNQAEAAHQAPGLVRPLPPG